MDEARRVQARDLIRGLKAGVAGEEVVTEGWSAANLQATQRLLGLLTPEEQGALQPEITFISSYGVLLVPTYSLLTQLRRSPRADRTPNRRHTPPERGLAAHCYIFPLIRESAGLTELQEFR